VRTTDRRGLRRALQGTGADVTEFGDDGAVVAGPEPRRIAESALAAGILLYELTPLTETLEDVYMAMTQNEVEYRSGAAAPTRPAPWAGTAARNGDRA
jgi:ABC-2 type transport system ATP-binding protein